MMLLSDSLTYPHSHVAGVLVVGSRQRAGLAVDMQLVGRGSGSAVFVSEDSGQQTAETCCASPHCP